METQKPEPVAYPPPAIGPVRPSSKWEGEYQAFLRCLPEFLKSHRGQYVAFHNGKLVDSDSDQLALILRVHRQHGYVPIHVDLVTEQPPLAHRWPHYRLYRPQDVE